VLIFPDNLKFLIFVPLVVNFHAGMRKGIRSTHLVVIGHLVAILLLVATCDSIKTEENLTGIFHPSGEEFAGSKTCVTCHPAIVASHANTPHSLTSRPGSISTILGNFDSGANEFMLNERLRVMVVKSDSGLFQRAMVDGIEVDKKPMEVTLGSGRQGQTYLFWKDGVLFQLPVSYHSASDSWTNSPGYPTDQIVFNRSIQARCLECHSTYFKIGRMTSDGQAFARDQVILGVDCERCHGPAGRHVNFQMENPGEKEAKYVINPARLTRQQKLDNCALCHSGIRDNFLPSFSYTVGDDLDDYFFPSRAPDSSTMLDVHGNQYGLLSGSKCFRMSDMDCSSCHNVHAKETKQVEVFSARCMNCHQEGSDKFCKQPIAAGLVLNKNCIDCHMPALPSRKVFLRSSATSKSTPFYVRTHLVGIYEEQVKLYLEKIEEEKTGVD
jgi:hypothetical protein